MVVVAMWGMWAFRWTERKRTAGEARGSGATVDEEFAQDIDEGIKTHRQPWNPHLAR